MTVSIEPLTRADADRCAELEAQLFDGDDPWPASAFLAELEGRHNHYVAARTEDKLVGYAGIARLGLLPPHEYEIHTIGVDPAFQGQGIGRRLLDALLAVRRRRRASTWRSAPTTQPRSRCTAAAGSSRSGCASGTTG